MQLVFEVQLFVKCIIVYVQFKSLLCYVGIITFIMHLDNVCLIDNTA